jgi:hypothetical protein
MVGELKKRRYVYDHCAGFKGKCAEPYVREEVVSERFAEILGRLSFGEEVLTWLTKALRESHVDEQSTRQPSHGRACEQRQLLNFVFSNSTWKNGTLTPVFRQPFDLIVKTTAVAKHEKGGEALNLPGHPVWLGHLDSNQD